MHQRFKFITGFIDQLLFDVEPRQKGSDRFAFISKHKVIIARLMLFRKQVKTPPEILIGIFFINRIMQVTVSRKSRHQIRELTGVVILLIISVLDDPDTQAILRIDIRIEFDPFIKREHTADVIKR